MSSTAVEGKISSQISETIGIMRSIKESIELTCEDKDAIEKYLFSIADAYPDTIPTGIYCGLEDGTYIDKMWTPDADWVMKDRPWYKDGLKADDVTFGETYLDSSTGNYIVSVYANIKDTKDNVIGVISADVQLNDMDAMLREQKILDHGYAYIVDASSGIIFGNSHNEEANGNDIRTLSDNVSKKIVNMQENDEYSNLEQIGNQYIYLYKIEGSNFISVCQVPDSDVEETVLSVERA